MGSTQISGVDGSPLGTYRTVCLIFSAFCGWLLAGGALENSLTVNGIRTHRLTTLEKVYVV